MKFSFAKTINSPKNAVGNLFFFHPGGLPARGISQITQSFPNYNLTHIEIRLVSSFMNSFNSEGKQLNFAKNIAQEIYSEIYVESKLPCLFIGWSLGGVIAFETAHLWQGKKPVLCFFDSTGPHAIDYFLAKWFGESNFKEFLKANGKSTSFDIDSSKWFAYSNKEMKNNLSYISNYFTMYLNALKEVNIPLKPPNYEYPNESVFITGLMEKAIKYGAFDNSLSYDGFYKVFEVYKEGIVKSLALLAGQTYQHYDGKLLLFKADNNEREDAYEPNYLGWEKLVAQIQLVSIPFDHYAMLSTEASEKYLVKEIARFLADTKESSYITV